MSLTNPTYENKGMPLLIKHLSCWVGLEGMVCREWSKSEAKTKERLQIQGLEQQRGVTH